MIHTIYGASIRRRLLYPVAWAITVGPVLAACGGRPGSDTGDGASPPVVMEAVTDSAFLPPVPLIVAVVVDQMRPDFIERYGPLFQDGLRRILDEGYTFTDAAHDHALTFTAPGHATLSTGVHPARSGIIANDWYERSEGWAEGRYAVRDTTSPILGHPGMEGRSPENLLRGGLADWVLYADSGATVVSLSRKDRAAITMSGRAKGEVYWLAEPSFEFVTSSYYQHAYPEWIVRVNERIPDLLRESVWADSVWESSIPEGTWLERPDSAWFEGDRTHTAFPHRYAEEGDEEFGNWLVDTPFPDIVVAHAAIEAIESLGLGQDPVTDYLSVSFSSTDYVGHEFGPLSWEQLDNLLHLDRTLGLLLTALDEKVGEGNWVLGLSSDHGVLTAPEHLVNMGVEDAFRLETYREVRQTAASASPDGDTGARSRARMAAAIEELDYVADAITVDELEASPGRTGVRDVDESVESYLRLYRNSYHPERRYGPVARQGVILRFRENTLRTSDVATHGTPYRYDRWVPLMFLGARVGTGSSDDEVHTVSFAPTLARVAGIPAPSDLDGPVLQIVVRTPQFP